MSIDPKSEYYDVGGIEVMEIIRAKLTEEQFRGYLMGNALKYLCRAGHKGDFERDIEKMNYYAAELLDMQHTHQSIFDENDDL